MELVEMPQGETYEQYSLYPGDGRSPVTGDDIRAATTFGRVTLGELGSVFDDLTDQHEQVLANVEGAIEASTSVGPRQAEEQNRLFVQRGIGGMIGADHFADEIDRHNTEVTRINNGLASTWVDWNIAREAELAALVDHVPPGTELAVYTQWLSPTTLEWDAYKADARRRYDQLRIDLDAAAEESSRIIQDRPSDEEVAEMISFGTIPGDDLTLVLEAFPSAVSVDALQSWFRVQIEAGRINGLNEVPPGLDEYSDELMTDSTIRQSMHAWLHADTAQGEADGTLIQDGVTSGTQWTNMVRRMGWIDSYARSAVSEGESMPADWFGYLRMANDQAFGSSDGVYDVAGYLRTADSPRLSSVFASGLVTLSNPALGGVDDDLPDVVVDAANPDSDPYIELLDILSNADEDSPVTEGSTLGPSVFSRVDRSG